MVVLSSFSLLISNTAFAADISEEITFQDITGEKIIFENTAGDNVTINGAKKEIAVFIGGILVAFIVDGAIIFTSGSSGGEWVSKALNYAKTHINCSNIYFSSKTAKPICHSGSRGSF